MQNLYKGIGIALFWLVASYQLGSAESLVASKVPLRETESFLKILKLRDHQQECNIQKLLRYMESSLCCRVLSSKVKLCLILLCKASQPS